MNNKPPMNDVLVKWQLQVAHLRDMMRQQGWDVYLGFLGTITTEQNEALLGLPPGTAPGTLDYYRGYVAGLRRAANLPQEILSNHQRAHTHDA
jgi:hypothetical protein